MIKNKIKHIKFFGLFLLVAILFYLGYYYPKLMEKEKADLIEYVSINCKYLGDDYINMMKKADLNSVRYIKFKCDKQNF